MKTKTLIAAAVLAFAGAAQAEMVEIDKSADGLVSLRVQEGSLKRTKTGANAVFGTARRDYKDGPDTRISNFRVSVSASTCNASAGPLVVTELTGEQKGTYQWVEGDGSLADLMGTLLCMAIKEKRGTQL